MANDAERRAAATAWFYNREPKCYGPDCEHQEVADCLAAHLARHFPDEPSDTADDTARLSPEEWSALNSAVAYWSMSTNCPSTEVAMTAHSALMKAARWIVAARAKETPDGD